MDVIRMTKSTGPSKSGRESYRTEDAAAFIERLSMGAYGKHLIGIIDDADSLSETVQNKLLKTLEEPAPGTILILAAVNRDNLLSTVRSRCSEIRLADYTDGPDSGAEEEAEDTALRELACMLTDRSCRFYEFRAALERAVGSREDALKVLSLFAEEMRRAMSGDAGGMDPGHAAACAEMAAVLEMDIRRDMNHSRGLKRLFLEVREI
jgi:DNA polymerase-3 subunit delta'